MRATVPGPASGTIQSLLDDLAPFSAKGEVHEFNHAARRVLAALI